MPSDKPRLYLALYARGGDGYHWALLVGPKHEDQNTRATRYHAKQHLTKWQYNEVNISTAATNMILIRIFAAKVQNMDRVESIMRSVPVRPNVPGWTCRSWVTEAYEKLRSDGKALSTCPDWETLSERALWYVRNKMEEHRFDGKAPGDQFSTWEVATYSIADGREIIP
ncbi:hypothetical protein CCM_02417 [Cordyceps militaris CM01]|uniref:Uncharacterized protein n=1 Tax=Cordyceps militaris (strain CM01) TaxID=983644 RepID=G3J9M0_CORMM|nr:uncharacterized protein CCM_02417 [Cordyceps militaris CM01]EGX94146.1 hypothetical protein CCM_02417 [Cordyceps militaris CM01]